MNDKSDDEWMKQHKHEMQLEYLRQQHESEVDYNEKLDKLYLEYKTKCDQIDREGELLKYVERDKYQAKIVEATNEWLKEQGRLREEFEVE
jgi:plasmid rolling circle replication initiator protein Rep